MSDHSSQGSSGDGAGGGAEVPAEARLQILAELREGMAEVPPTVVALIQGNVSDADAMVRGTATVAGEVIDEVSDALVRGNIVAEVSAHEKALRYPKFRVRYVLDLLFALVEAHGSQSHAISGWTLAQAQLLEATQAARDTRTSLLRGLRRATEHDTEARAELSTRRGKASQTAQISASLRGLGDLVDAWLAHPTRAPLLTLGAVDASDAVIARSAAATLETATRAVLAFTASAKDVPSTNLVEGRLMLEMAQLHRALEDQRGRIAGLPRLRLGDTLRREFRRIAAASADADAEPTDPKPTDPDPMDPEPTDPADPSA